MLQIIKIHVCRIVKNNRIGNVLSLPESPILKHSKGHPKPNFLDHIFRCMYHWATRKVFVNEPKTAFLHLVKMSIFGKRYKKLIKKCREQTKRNIFNDNCRRRNENK